MQPHSLICFCRERDFICFCWAREFTLGRLLCEYGSGKERGGGWVGISFSSLLFVQILSLFYLFLFVIPRCIFPVKTKQIPIRISPLQPISMHEVSVRKLLEEPDKMRRQYFSWTGTVSGVSYFQLVRLVTFSSWKPALAALLYLLPDFCRSRLLDLHSSMK